MTPWTAAYRAPPSMGFSRQEDWSDESFEFYLGQNEAAAWEAASQIALRDCSKAAVAESQYTRFWWRGSSNTMKHSIYKRFFVSHEDLMSP